MSMRRFYRDVGVVPQDSGFAITLDGKPMRSPAGHAFSLPTQRLAEAVADEWRVQEKTIQPAHMPMMQLAATAVDHVPAQKPMMIERLLAYLDSELVCLRVSQPAALAMRQAEIWQPPLDWFNRRYDVHMAPALGLNLSPLPQEARARIHHALAALDNWQLIGVQTAILTAGSIVLGLALYEGAMGADRVFDAAELETTHQLDVWGPDAELEQKRNDVSKELANVARWFELLKG